MDEYIIPTICRDIFGVPYNLARVFKYKPWIRTLSPKIIDVTEIVQKLFVISSKIVLYIFENLNTRDAVYGAYVNMYINEIVHIKSTKTAWKICNGQFASRMLLNLGKVNTRTLRYLCDIYSNTMTFNNINIGTTASLALIRHVHRYSGLNSGDFENVCANKSLSDSEVDEFYRNDQCSKFWPILEKLRPDLARRHFMAYRNYLRNKIHAEITRANIMCNKYNYPIIAMRESVTH